MSLARLIIDPPARGPWNMAVDDALLESAGEGTTTLRLYEWSEPTLSLGYFQAAAERAGHVASRDCPLVRRASGGGAILHDRELTYCLAMPIAERFGARANLLYAAVHKALIESLAAFGVPSHLHEPTAAEAATAPPPFLCFQRRTRGDVLCGQSKIAGSAQRRQRGGLVQHGSILLAQSAAALELPGIEQIAGISLAASELAADLADRLAGKLGLRWVNSVLTDHERSRANRFENDRFATAAWTYRR